MVQAMERAGELCRTLYDTAIGYAALGKLFLSDLLPVAHHNCLDKHLILIVGSFPPAFNGGVFRPTALVRTAVDAGWKATVICAATQTTVSEAGLHMLDTIPQTLRIERLQPSVNPSYRLFPRVNGGFPNVFAAVATARQLFGRHPPAIVMASGPPFWTFVAARAIARRYGVPLVLDYRDEWTECPFSFVSAGRWDRAFEQRCLRNADRVIFTTHSQLEHQLSVFEELDRDRCIVVPNGWDPDELRLSSRLDERPVSSDGGKAIHFVGTLGNHTLPGAFLSAIQDVLDKDLANRQNVRLLFVGRKTSAALEQLSAFRYPHCIEQTGEVTHADAFALMQRSAALLLLNPPPLARYIPGKLYDYLAAKRPILVFGDTGESAALVRTLRAGIVIPESDPVALKHALTDILNGTAELPADERREQWLARQTRAELSRQIIEQIARLRERTSSKQHGCAQGQQAR